MNVSEKSQVIWLAPERCATKITKKIFERYDFYNVSEKNNFTPTSFSIDKHSHSNKIVGGYENFKTILSIRNPYDFVFSIFVNKYYSKPITKETEGMDQIFSDWIRKTFLNHWNYVFLCPFYNNEQSFFIKWKFDESFSPDFVIHTENLYYDLIKLPFIETESEEYKTELKELVENNGFINKRYVQFQDLYNSKDAKLIYTYFKTSFDKFGYSPFSFTKTELTEEEKLQFIESDLER